MTTLPTVFEADPDDAERLHVCAGALRAAAPVRWISAGLTLTAAMTLAVTLFVLREPTTQLLLSLTIMTGLAVQWIGYRIRFDQTLFRSLAEEARGGTIDLARFDRTMTSLALMPRHKAGRAVHVRCRGALRLLYALGALGVAQTLLLVAAIIVPAPV